MGKDARLSFRISDHLSERVDRAIDEAGGQIRDRSEFGTKAVKFYLDYIENTQSEDEIVLNAILALADKVGVRGSETKQIKKILREKMLIPGTIPSMKTPESHPEFEKLIGLFDKLRTSSNQELYKEMMVDMKDVAYDDVPEVYERYSEAFFLGKSPRKQKEEKITA